jgi:hypothetical protein
MYQKIKTKLKASALVVTMIILGLMLVSTLSIALVSVQERKASLGEDSSNKAYYKAEDGVEIVLKDILKGGHTAANQLDDCNTTSGLIEKDGYTVELRKADDTKISCTETTSLSQIASVKSVGTVGGNQRAVQVAVAGGDYQVSCTNTFLEPDKNEQMCCRIDTHYGTVTCKKSTMLITYDFFPLSWDTVAGPSFAAAPGNYQLSCESSFYKNGGNNAGSTICCRTNSDNGNTNCEYGQGFFGPIWRPLKDLSF